MRSNIHVLAAALALALVSWDRAGATEPAAPAAPERIVGWCAAKWTSGASGKFQCDALAADKKTKVPVTRDNFSLFKICVNDGRLKKYTYDGGKQSAGFEPKGKEPSLCQDIKPVKRVPETCVCEGKKCDPPKDGFACLAFGYVDGKEQGKAEKKK